MRNSGRVGNTSIKIQPIDAGAENVEQTLTLKDAAQVSLVNMIPREDSNETRQDSETVLAVHPDRQLIVGAAYYNVGLDNRSNSLPLYLSTNSGWSWQLKPLIPVGALGNQSYSFSGNGKKLYGAILNSPTLQVSVLETDDPTNGALMRVISELNSEGSGAGDSPFIQTRVFNQDRIYVGQNYFGPELGTGKTAAVRVSTDGGRTFRLLGVEARETAGQDGPPVRPSVAKDGTVYVAFMRYTKVETIRSELGQFKMTGDIVITRDDEGAVGRTAFRSLMEPSDRKPGRLVAQGLLIPFNSRLGEQRIGEDLALAVNPNDSATIYLGWGEQDTSNNIYTLRVRKSTDRGQTWSDDLIKIDSAVALSLAVADDGTVGLLYQQLLNQGSPQAHWETHFQTSIDGSHNWNDMVLTSFPAGQPVRKFDPYLGDKTQLVSIANHFYGAFSAPNFPDPNNFPQGVRFQRQHKIGQLLSNDGTTAIDASIDPYFFHVPPRMEVARAMVPPQITASPAEDVTTVATSTFKLFRIQIFVWAGIFILGIGLFVWWTWFRAPENVKGTVDRLLEQRIHGPTLVNYVGYVMALLTDDKGDEIKMLRRGDRCNLSVRFADEKPSQSAGEPVNISGGENAPEAVFKVVVDGNDFAVAADRDRSGSTSYKMISVPARGTATVSFTLTAPEEAGRHSLFVQVFQKTRLIQIVTLTLNVY